MDLSAASLLAQLRLCAAQDDATPVADTRRRLPEWIRTPLVVAIDVLETGMQAQGTTEGVRTGSSGLVQKAYADGETLVRDVNRYLKGLPRSAGRDAALAHYDLSAGLDGNLTHARTEALLRGFVALGVARATPAAIHLRPEDVRAAAALLATLDAHKPTATVGIRASATGAKNEALDAAEDVRSRAYHYLCAALPEKTFDPLLAAYGFDPRTNTGQRLVEGEPGATK